MKHIFLLCWSKLCAILLLTIVTILFFSSFLSGGEADVSGSRNPLSPENSKDTEDIDTIQPNLLMEYNAGVDEGQITPLEILFYAYDLLYNRRQADMNREYKTPVSLKRIDSIVYKNGINGYFNGIKGYQLIDVAQSSLMPEKVYSISDNTISMLTNMNSGDIDYLVIISIFSVRRLLIFAVENNDIVVIYNSNEVSSEGQSNTNNTYSVNLPIKMNTVNRIYIHSDNRIDIYEDPNPMNIHGIAASILIKNNHITFSAR